MDYEKILEKYQYDENVLPKEILANLWSETRALMADLEYIKEHHFRTNRSKYLIDIIPSLGSVIMDRFFKEIFRHIADWGYLTNEQWVYRNLLIYKITYNLMQQINKWEFENSDNDFEKLEEWRKVVKYYTSVDIKERIHCFIGCSQMINKADQAWNEYGKRVEGWVFK
jgi:hypothetical protein